MGLGTIYLLCFAGVVLFFISGDRGVHHPNNSLIDYLELCNYYLDSSRSHALSCINTHVTVNTNFAHPLTRIPLECNRGMRNKDHRTLGA